MKVFLEVTVSKIVLHVWINKNKNKINGIHTCDFVWFSFKYLGLSAGAVPLAGQARTLWQLEVAVAMQHGGVPSRVIHHGPLPVTQQDLGSMTTLPEISLKIVLYLRCFCFCLSIKKKPHRNPLTFLGR